MRCSTLVSLLMLAGGFASGCGDGDTLGTNGGTGGGSPDDGGASGTELRAIRNPALQYCRRGAAL